MSSKPFERYTEIETTLTPYECQAILCALPLTVLAASTTSERQQYNALCIELTAKLNKHIRIYTKPELMTMSRAVELSIGVVSGTRDDLIAKMRDSSDWCSELRQHFFTLNRLLPIFREITASLDKRSQ